MNYSIADRRVEISTATSQKQSGCHDNAVTINLWSIWQVQ